MNQNWQLEKNETRMREFWITPYGWGGFLLMNIIKIFTALLLALGWQRECTMKIKIKLSTPNEWLLVCSNTSNIYSLWILWIQYIRIFHGPKSWNTISWCSVKDTPYYMNYRSNWDPNVKWKSLLTEMFKVWAPPRLQMRLVVCWEICGQDCTHEEWAIVVVPVPV